MEALRVYENLLIQSYQGPYKVYFNGDEKFTFMSDLLGNESHIIIDSKVAEIYADQLGLSGNKNIIKIVAIEENKSIEKILPIIEQLLENKIKKNHKLLAIGGGIIQDITCFISSILLRGISWKYLPTTLLSQADSCIGSKSSINLGHTKNILGTFNPPNEVFINHHFLDSLNPTEILSGIGEIIKVHAISGKLQFDQLARDYDDLTSDKSTLLRYVQQSLKIKKKFIELDEFDVDVRNIFNYGHSFGHAIEAATNFAIPHGVAVTMGIYIANQVAFHKGLLPIEEVDRMKGILQKNYDKFKSVPISFEKFISALQKDKKNINSTLVLILPVGESSNIEKVRIESDPKFFELLNSIILGLCK